MSLVNHTVARAASLMMAAAILSAQVHAAGAFDHEAFARRALEQHIVPGYRQFSAAADAQDAAVAGLCTAPSGASLTSARQAFGAALAAWGRVEHLRIGPIMDQNRYAGLLLWPDPRGIARRQIERALAQQDRDVLSPEALAGKSVALRGFAALDVLLFAKGSDDLAASSPAHAFRCGYASAVAKVMAQAAKDTLQAWSAPDGFAARWLNPGADNPVFLSAKETTQAIGQAYLNGVKHLRNVRLAGPLGFKDRNVRPLEPPVPYSGRALGLAIANIEGLRALLLETGLSDPPVPGAPPHTVMQSTVNEFGTAISTIRKASALSKKPFEDAAARNQLILVGFPLKNAFDTGAAYLAEEAGLTIGFNAIDGD
jgi:predicted lipoprotein